MIFTIKEVKEEFASNGSEYRKVTGVNDKGDVSTKNIFNNLEDKWPLLEENATVELKMEKSGKFWNVADISKVDLSKALPDKPMPKAVESKYKADPDKINSIEGQVALKCAVELLGVGVIGKEQVLSYAEAFRRFLSGDIKVKDEEVFVTLMGKHFKLGE